MERKTITRGAKTSDDVLALLFGDRQYGVPELTIADIFEQPIPQGFEPMAAELRRELKLLDLPDSTVRDDMYAAYGHDVTLLNGRLAEFKQFVQTAVAASVIKHKPIWIAGSAVTVLDYLELHMPSMARVPLIELTAEAAAMPEDELLTHLKQEAENAAVAFFKILCLWLDAMVTREFVGLLKVTSSEAARYHYFRPRQDESVIEKKNTRHEQVGYDATKPYGMRTQYEQRSDALIEIRHDLERHDHDIVQMKMHTVAEYPDEMPLRVAGFLESAPEFVRRHLAVVSGVIVREQVLRRTTDVELKEATIIESTWLDSPAITLANRYVLVGWNGKDMLNESVAFFSGQRACPPPPAPPTRVVRAWRWMTASRSRLVKVASLALGMPALGALSWWSLRAGIAVAIVLLVVLAVWKLLRD